MIYSLERDFCFIHCPRTSGTAISKALSILVPDAVYDEPRKHWLHSQLPVTLKSLRAFTVLRPLQEVRVSYYRFITKWIREADPEYPATVWLVRHADRLAKMTIEEYLKSNEPPVDVDVFADGCHRVFQYHDSPYHEIAEFCGVVPVEFVTLVNMFRRLTA